MKLKSGKRFALATAILFIFLVGATSLGISEQRNRRKSVVEGKVVLIAEPEKQTFKSGEPITVKFSLRNNTKPGNLHRSDGPEKRQRSGD